MPYRPSPEKVSRHRELLDQIAEAVKAQEPLSIRVPAGVSKGAMYDRLRDVLNAAREFPESDLDAKLAGLVTVKQAGTGDKLVIHPDPLASLEYVPKEEEIEEMTQEVEDYLREEGLVSDSDGDA